MTNFRVVLLWLFFISLSAGQLTALRLDNNIRIYLHDVLLVFLLATSFGKSSLRWRRSPLPLIFAFSGIGILSLAVNAWRLPFWQLAIGSLHLVRWTIYGILFAVSASQLAPINTWLSGLYTSGAVLAVFGIIQYVVYPDLGGLKHLGWDPHYYRVFSTLFDPNFLSIYLLSCFGIGIYFGVRSNRLLIILSQVVIAIAYLFTYSRSGYLAFLVGLATWVILERKWRAGGIASLIFLLVIVYLPRSAADVLSLDRMTPALARVGNWQQSLSSALRSPILGYGFNTLGISVGNTGGGKIDSSLLFVLLTTGIVGLLIYLWLLISLFRLGAELRKKPETRTFGTLYIAFLTTVLTHSQFNNSLFYPWMMIFLWIITGVGQRLKDES